MVALLKHCCCAGLIPFSVRYHFSIKHTSFRAGWSFPDSYGFDVRYDKMPYFDGLLITSSSFYLSTKDDYNSLKLRGGSFLLGDIYSVERINDEIIGKDFDGLKNLFRFYPMEIFYNFTSDIATLIDSLNDKLIRFLSDKYLPIFPTIPNYPALPPHGIYEDPYEKYVFPAFKHLSGFYIDAYYDLKFSVKVNSLNKIEALEYHSFDLVSTSDNLGDY